MDYKMSNCIYCNVFPKNGHYDGCCRTCAMSKGYGNHGQGCTKNSTQLCIFCKQYPKNGHYDGCCRTCAMSQGHGNHGQSCTSTVYDISKRLQFNIVNTYHVPPVIKFYNKDEPYYEFTNFYPIPITMAYNGKLFVFPTSEHYYQAMKYVNEPNWEMHLFMIITNSSPSFAYNYSKKNPFNQSFHSIKDIVMYNVVFAKFYQNQKLGNLLKSTGNAELIENSPSDFYWGIGDGTGQNKLGKILMTVRSQI